MKVYKCIHFMKITMVLLTFLQQGGSRTTRLAYGAIVKDVVNLGVEDCKVLEHNNQLTLNA